MSNDFTKVYQFLSSYGSDNAWVKAADTNEDNNVSKREFVDFVEKDYAKWNGNESGETLSADIINKFWTEINNTVHGTQSSSKANKNNLDEKEQEALNKKLEAYVALNDFIKTNVSIPSVLTTTGAQWKAAVSDELSAILEKNASKGADALKEIWKEKLPEIENKQTALFCATEYQNTLVNGILKDYPDYKVADDSTLNKLIDSYLKTIDGDSDPSTIKSDIQEIMKSYLATAGLGEGGSLPEGMTYEQKDSEKLNGIQEAVARASMKKNLESIKTDPNYEKYKEYYDKAIEEFINAEVGKATVGTFDAVKGTGLEAFKESKAFKNIQNRITFDTNFKNIDLTKLTENTLYKAIEEKLGATLAERIVKGGEEFPAYRSIMEAAMEKLEAGEFLKEDGSLDVDAMKDYLLQEIMAKLNEFTEGAFGDMKLSELKDLYDKIIGNADSITDVDQRTSAKKQAAIDYCNAVAGKSNPLRQAVIDIFGDNWANKINEMITPDIQTDMEKLFAKVNEIGDITAITDAEKNGMLNGVAETYTVAVGEAKSVNLPTSATVDGKTVTTDRITYKTSGAISVQDGKLVIDSSKAGTYTGTLTMFIDGVEVASKTITVTANLEANLDDDDKTQINGDSIKNIMLTNNNIIGASNWVRPGSALSTGKTFITSTLDSIQSSLISGGYDADKTKKAIDVLKQYYLQILDKVNNNYRSFSKKDYGSKGIETTNQGNFTYKGADGTDKTLTLNANWKEYKNAYDFSADEITCSSGFGISHQRKGDDNYKFYFNTKALLTVFKTVYDNI